MSEQCKDCGNWITIRNNMIYCYHCENYTSFRSWYD